MPTTQCEPGPMARSDASIASGVMDVCGLPVRETISGVVSVLPPGASAVGQPVRKSLRFDDVCPQFVAYPFDGSLQSKLGLMSASAPSISSIVRVDELFGCAASSAFGWSAFGWSAWVDA